MFFGEMIDVINDIVFTDVKPYSLMEIDGRFGRTCIELKELKLSL